MTEHKLKLKPEYEEKKEEFESLLDEICCSCHINPPCELCSHKGNPTNLIENEDAWFHMCPDCGTVMKKKGTNYNCPHCGFTTCGSC